PAAPPAPAIQPVPRPAPPARQPVTENRPPARVVPALPSAGSGQVWQVQIGAYTVLENAQDAFERAKNAGFSPVYERYARVYRVILPSVQSADIPAVARKLGAAGFSEIWLREK
ncbi:MAG: SPOR domain-containing protein, partial [Spirochaetales bacterium]|nr:SPOR domain-containing protein [Spirochaetales bacterium]